MVEYEKPAADGSIAASRVDDSGLLLGEPDPHIDVKTHWKGGASEETVDCGGDAGKQNVKTYPRCLVNGFTLSVGDYVLLTPEATDELCELARVENMYQHPSEGKMFRARWLWHNDDIEVGDLEPLPHEVYFSDTFDDNPIEAVEGCAPVLRPHQPPARWTQA